MYKKIKIFIYTFAKYAGFFALASFLTRKSMRILCYHGISFADEHEWHPGLFITTETLRRRFGILKKRNYPVLPLDEAIRKYKSGTLPNHATVITVDDGFHDNYALGLPIFKEYKFPVTIYVSSYYIQKQTPVFRLVVQYLFWSSEVVDIDLSKIDSYFTAVEKYNISEPHTRLSVLTKLIEYGESKLQDPQRVELLKKIANALEVDYARIESKKLFHFMTAEELVALDKAGVNIELHTHRHQFLKSAEQADREIKENKTVLEGILGKKLVHFCYPSGVWSNALWPALEKNEIVSSTTCDPGLNPVGQVHLYGLKRYLDSEGNSDIELEAELTGFAELMRLLLRKKETGSSP